MGESEASTIGGQYDACATMTQRRVSTKRGHYVENELTAMTEDLGGYRELK